MEGTSPRGDVRVGVHDVGSRVVLRYRLAPDEHGPSGETLTDAVGELLGWTEGPHGAATVLRRTGEEVSVPLRLLVAGKVLPAAPPRRSPPRPQP